MTQCLRVPSRIPLGNILGSTKDHESLGKFLCSCCDTGHNCFPELVLASKQSSECPLSDIH